MATSPNQTFAEHVQARWELKLETTHREVETRSFTWPEGEPSIDVSIAPDVWLRLEIVHGFAVSVRETSSAFDTLYDYDLVLDGCPTLHVIPRGEETADA